MIEAQLGNEATREELVKNADDRKSGAINYDWSPWFTLLCDPLGSFVL